MVDEQDFLARGVVGHFFCDTDFADPTAIDLDVAYFPHSAISTPDQVWLPAATRTSSAS
jgi:hypothetical protein